MRKSVTSCRLSALVMSAGLLGCRHASPTASATATNPAAATPSAAPEVLPAPAAQVDPSELTGEFACGPFDTRELTAEARPLLGDRLRVRFFAGGVDQGNQEAGRILLERNGVTLFVGARETFTRGDASFARRASKRASFEGTYTPRTVQAGELAIVAGFRNVPAEGFVNAHGWFLDANQDVLDIAVSISASALEASPEPCRKLTQRLLASVTKGARSLRYGSTGEQTRTASYATFRYRLPDDWAVADAMGIHDFSRIHFRKRGVFGVSDPGMVQIGLDSHPGDWTLPGKELGTRPGQLLGMKVSWHRIKDDEGQYGAWTVSDAVERGDHAVGAVSAGTEADLAESLRFAESVRVTR